MDQVTTTINGAIKKTLRKSSRKNTHIKYSNRDYFDLREWGEGWEGGSGDVSTNKSSECVRAREMTWRWETMAAENTDAKSSSKSRNKARQRTRATRSTPHRAARPRSGLLRAAVLETNEPAAAAAAVACSTGDGYNERDTQQYHPSHFNITHNQQRSQRREKKLAKKSEFSICDYLERKTWRTTGSTYYFFQLTQIRTRLRAAARQAGGQTKSHVNRRGAMSTFDSNHTKNENSEHSLRREENNNERGETLSS